MERARCAHLAGRGGSRPPILGRMESRIVFAILGAAERTRDRGGIWRRSRSNGTGFRSLVDEPGIRRLRPGRWTDRGSPSCNRATAATRLDDRARRDDKTLIATCREELRSNRNWRGRPTDRPLLARMATGSHRVDATPEGDPRETSSGCGRRSPVLAATRPSARIHQRPLLPSRAPRRSRSPPDADIGVPCSTSASPRTARLERPGDRCHGTALPVDRGRQRPSILVPDVSPGRPGRRCRRLHRGGIRRHAPVGAGSGVLPAL